MTHAELVALLSEASESLRAYADKDQVQELESWHGNRWSKAQDALARIDAALAGRAEGSTEDVVESVSVEWKTEWHAFDRPKNEYTNLQGTNITLRVGQDQFSQGGWCWEVTNYGPASSEAEAKSAAIKAARWLR
jgi:hypothetical protein